MSGDVKINGTSYPMLLLRGAPGTFFWDQLHVELLRALDVKLVCPMGWVAYIQYTRRA